MKCLEENEVLIIVILLVNFVSDTLWPRAVFQIHFNPDSNSGQFPNKIFLKLKNTAAIL